LAKRRPEGIRDYHEPAGGWGALKALAVALKQQQVVLQGIPMLLKQNQPEASIAPDAPGRGGLVRLRPFSSLRVAHRRGREKRESDRFFGVGRRSDAPGADVQTPPATDRSGAVFD
jgi:hypothetical protein